MKSFWPLWAKGSLTILKDVRKINILSTKNAMMHYIGSYIGQLLVLNCRVAKF